MKKIFVLTGEPSGDKLASKVISQVRNSKSDIEYLSVGGEHLKSLGIKSLYDLNEVTYLGFTKVLLNIFKIKKKINETVDKIEYRVKKLKSFLDHVLLLFPFEKKYFDKENIQSTFTGHPLLENNEKSKIDISQIIKDHKKIISIFPGSRRSEIDVLLPILIDFIKLMNEKYNDIFYVFHSTTEFNKLIQDKLIKVGFKNCGSISDEKIKSEILKSSTFAVAKSGTISLEICNAKVPSIVIYKMNSINYLIIKMLVKVKYANIINIAANEEIIPELLQSNCNSKNIFNNVDSLFENNESMLNQIDKSQEILKNFKTNQSPKIAATVLTNSL